MITIAVDFDGTCVSHDYPEVGKDIGAVPVLKRLVKEGHQLILWTMRCDTPNLRERQVLSEATIWFSNNEIPLYGCQSNPTQKTWTGSPKCYAQLYIDDAALGCPLTMDQSISTRPFVDWYLVERMLVKSGILTEKSEEPKSESQITEYVLRNPIGVMPKWLWQERRANELCAVITSYKSVALGPNPEWLAELRDMGIEYTTGLIELGPDHPLRSSTK